MKSLLFEKLELLSLTEKKARTVAFDPRLTVITGGNGVGKSSIIKSIYWTLGASPMAIHRRWANANVKSRLTFTVDGTRYSAVRNHDTVAVFDAQGTRLISTNAITSELGPFIAGLLDFGLVFSNRQGELETPPPAYAFLPFYVDQDGGWERQLNSFDRLGQYTNFRTPLVEFHSGIRPNEYYGLSAEKKKVELERSGFVAERGVVQKALERLGPELMFSGLELTVEEHDKSVNELLVKLKELQQARQKRAAEFADVLDQRTALESEIAIVKAAADELAKDSDWAFKDGRAEIPCPTCGTVHSNNFHNRFAILADREQCFDFVLKAEGIVAELAGKARKAQADIEANQRTAAEIQEILNRKRGEVTLRDVIESQGRTAARAVFNGQIAELDGMIGERSGLIHDLESKLADLRDNKRRREIEQYYATLMQSYTQRLNVIDPDRDAISKITGKVTETGSEQPRLLLSYRLALLNTIHRYTTSFTAPFVIDSPIQQDQDKRNAPAMISLILSSRPAGGQTILGTVSLHDNEPIEGTVITLTTKRSALLDEEYEDVLGVMQPLLMAM